ncbi:MAG: hypothetical protein IPL61_17145 [Myxococcales bacterium]|nr:hypothetical protein [Myxococcales bacterium]
MLTAAHCIDPAVLGQSQAQITASLRVHFDTVNIFTSAGIVVPATEDHQAPAVQRERARHPRHRGSSAWRRR